MGQPKRDRVKTFGALKVGTLSRSESSSNRAAVRERRQFHSRNLMKIEVFGTKIKHKRDRVPIFSPESRHPVRPKKLRKPWAGDKRLFNKSFASHLVFLLPYDMV